MRYLLHLLVFFGLAAAIGLGLTGLAVQRGVSFGALRIGPWTAYPALGSGSADPYARATLAHQGRIPLALGDGLEFTSATDDEGEPLDHACDYVMEGDALPARYWTIAVEGGRAAADSGPRALTSAELLRRENGDYGIALAPRARPGNWLDTSGSDGRFHLVLRLYDTPLNAASRSQAVSAFPSVRRVSCP